MRIVGLTGGIACGKSLVTSELIEMGVPVLDCDLIARIVVEPGTPARLQIVETFKRDLEAIGEEIEFEDGSLNRKGLGKIVFANEEKRAQLTQITGKAISRYLMEKFAWHFVRGTPMVVVDAPTLYESKFLVKFCSEIVVVAVNPALQLERLLKRDVDLAEKDAINRIKSQIPVDEKVKMADAVIWNEGSKDETKASVAEVFAKQLEKSHALKYRLFSGPGVAAAVVASAAFLAWYSSSSSSRL